MKLTITKSITLEMKAEDIAKLHRSGVLSRFIWSWFKYAPLTLKVHNDETPTHP